MNNTANVIQGFIDDGEPGESRLLRQGNDIFGGITAVEAFHLGSRRHHIHGIVAGELNSSREQGGGVIFQEPLQRRALHEAGELISCPGSRELLFGFDTHGPEYPVGTSVQYRDEGSKRPRERDLQGD